MFDWLLQEIQSIKTNKFHVVNRPEAQLMKDIEEKEQIVLPFSYNNFRARFGQARLYRATGLSYYHISIKIEPERCMTCGQAYYEFAWHNDLHYYFKESLLGIDLESPVFVRMENEIIEAEKDFAEWLKQACSASRRKYTVSEWMEIKNGPRPFDSREMEIVSSRAKFTWKLLYVSDDSKIHILIQNRSKTKLPYLSLGVRRKDGSMTGSIRISIASLPPGEEGLFEKECYKGTMKPEEIELFDLPEPGPEDRVQYWEFREIPKDGE